MLLYTKNYNKDTGLRLYNHYWAMKFPSLCDDCKGEKVLDSQCKTLLGFCDDDNVARTNLFVWLLFSCGLAAIVMHTYAIICGVGILNKYRWKCCRLSFPLRNIYALHLIILGATAVTLFIWIYSSKSTMYRFTWSWTLWVYLSLVVLQFLLRIHFKYYNG